MTAPRIVTLPGDGIGPEIDAAARELLAALGEFEFDERLLGGRQSTRTAVALTDEVLDACRSRRRRPACGRRRPEVGHDRP